MSDKPKQLLLIILTMSLAPMAMFGPIGLIVQILICIITIILTVLIEPYGLFIIIPAMMIINIFLSFAILDTIRSWHTDD